MSLPEVVLNDTPVQSIDQRYHVEMVVKTTCIHGKDRYNIKSLAACPADAHAEEVAHAS